MLCAFLALFTLDSSSISTRYCCQALQPCEITIKTWSIASEKQLSTISSNEETFAPLICSLFCLWMTNGIITFIKDNSSLQSCFFFFSFFTTDLVFSRYTFTLWFFIVWVYSTNLFSLYKRHEKKINDSNIAILTCCISQLSSAIYLIY